MAWEESNPVSTHFLGRHSHEFVLLVSIHIHMSGTMCHLSPMPLHIRTHTHMKTRMHAHGSTHPGELVGQPEARLKAQKLDQRETQRQTAHGPHCACRSLQGSEGRSLYTHG